MLQQTTVATVLRRYGSFLERFKSLASIAQASEEELLKAWEGLGYYRRARNLYMVAQMTGGVLPTTAEELMRLPGVGKTTAHAIASFAYGAQLPILDVNVKRIVGRVYGNYNEKGLWEGAWQLLGDSPAPLFNQAMMDLGSLICQPTPQCTHCPLKSQCGRYPDPPKQQKRRPVERVAIIVASDRQGRLWLQRRETELLGGLWGFAQVPIDATRVVIDGEEMAIDERMHKGSLRHLYTHFELQADVYLLFLEREKEGWLMPSEIERLPLSTLDRKVLRLL
ncbi:MAG: NUDIX domain-containing protein [Campylobacterales bacterium]